MKLNKLKEAPYVDLKGRPANTWAIFGSSQRGKSTLIYEIYKKYYEKDTKLITILISPSCHIGIFDKLPNKVIKVNKFNKDTIQLLRDLQKIQNKTINGYKFLIIIDDCVDIRFCKILNELILVMRNSLFSTILSIQYDKLLSKQGRSSVNNCIFFGMNTDESIEGLLKSFFKSEFSKINGKTRMIELIDEYRNYTDQSGGHCFFIFNPQDRTLTLNTLIIN